MELRTEICLLFDKTIKAKGTAGITIICIDGIVSIVRFGQIENLGLLSNGSDCR